MAGVLVGEVLDHAERLRAIGALGGPKVAHRNLLALLVVAEGCREKTRAGHVPQTRVAQAIGGVARTASRALADLSSAGLISVVQKGNRTEGGGRPTLYRLCDLRAIDTTPKVSARSAENDMTPRVSGRSDDKARSTRHLDPIDTTLGPDRHDTLGVTLPVKDLPEKNYGSSSHLSNAGARAENAAELIDAEIVVADPLDVLFGSAAIAPLRPPPRPTEWGDDETPDPLSDPIGWLGRSLPQGFFIGERAKAEQLLAEGKSPSGTRYAILKLRNAETTPKRRAVR